jgi:perosamine synthetase
MTLTEHRRIPFADPHISEDDVSSVVEALRRKCLSQGEYVNKFEEEFAQYIGSKYAIAVSNGTTALHTAMVAINVGLGDEVIVPSFSFISTANCVLYQSAKPVFVDIESSTYNLAPSKLEEKISEKTKAIIPVHYAGHPADMTPIMEIAKNHSLYVIEDAAEAHGSLYKGKKAGSLGHIACFSFYPNKNMTTGEGGMITTNDEELAEKMRMIRSHGQDRRYHHIMLGYNYRMTDIQAALGITQLRRLDSVIGRKNEVAQYYTERISDGFSHEIIPPYVAPYALHTYMFYTISFKAQGKRDDVEEKLEEAGVETRVAFIPIHLQPLYQDLFHCKKGFLPVTEQAGNTVLSIPIYAHMTRQEQNYVLERLREALCI